MQDAKYPSLQYRRLRSCEGCTQCKGADIESPEVPPGETLQLLEHYFLTTNQLTHTSVASEVEILSPHNCFIVVVWCYALFQELL